MKTFFCFLGFFFMINAYSQPGSLDNTFGEGGKVVTYYKDGYAMCFNAVKQADNKIVTGGTFYANNGSIGFMAVRYLDNGQLDKSFGDDGRIVTILDYDYQQAFAITVQKDGKIILAGHVVSGMFGTYYDIILLRYNINGSLDESFGDNGKVVSDFGKDDYIYAISIQEDGKIVIVGNNQSQYFLAARYLPDGSLDNTFGIGGYVTTALSGLANAYTVLIQPDGKILTAGSTAGSFALVRYLSNGALDESFGVAGKVKTDFPSYSETISDIALQKDGKILAAGLEDASSGGNMAVAQYTVDGKLDSSFGIFGKTTLIFDTLASRANAIDVQTDGKIILVGNTSDKVYRAGVDFIVARLQPSGMPDSSFGDKGIVRTDFGLYGESVIAGFLDNNNKIVAVGSAYNFDTPSRPLILLARYNNDETNTPKFVKIKHWLHHHGFTWEDWPGKNINYYAVQRSPALGGSNAFNEISRVSNSNNQQQFTYEDAAPLTGDNYYRLAAVSADGGTAYSNIIAISNNSSAIKIYPNPVKNNLQVEGLNAAQKTKLTIADFSGNTRMSTAVNSNTFNWNVSQLKQGNYILKIESNNKVVTKKFVKE